MIVPDAVRLILARHERNFPTDAVAGLAGDYRNPVVLFLPDGLRVEPTRADTEAALRALQAVALAHGMATVRVTILDVRALRPDRPSVLLKWDYLNRQKAVIAHSQVRYFLSRDPDGRFLIEMVECEKTAFPEDQRVWPIRDRRKT